MGLVCHHCPEETISPQVASFFTGSSGAGEGGLSGQQTKLLCASVKRTGYHHQDVLSHLEAGTDAGSDAE